MRHCALVATAILALVPLSACAHLSNVLSDVKPGMDRREAIASVDAKPRSYVRGSTEYLVYRFGVSFGSLYSDHPWTLYFVKLAEGQVVDKGVLGSAEERAIHEIDPSFDREKLEARSAPGTPGA